MARYDVLVDELTYIRLVLYVGYCLSLSAVSSVPLTNIPLLTLISMDGFRHDYLDKMPRNTTPNFNYFIENGVKAERIMNVFPANTFPNHMTILTGTYPEFHGVVNNYFYDPLLNDIFDMGNKIQNIYGSQFFDNGAEPIWVTNDKHGSGRSSGSILWPGGLAPVKCIRPRIVPDKFLFTPKAEYSYEARVNQLIEWFVDKENPINFAMLYFDEPDLTGHKHGPDSEEVKNMIKKLDSTLGYLKAKLAQNDLLERMNIIITSDHGMQMMDKDRINLDLILQREWYVSRTGFKNTIVPLIEPKEGYEDKVMTALFGTKNPTNGKEHEKFFAWLRRGKEMKSRHYSQNRRIDTIILEAKKGQRFTLNGRGKGSSVATHGYNPEVVSEVLPFFIASGPAFKKGYAKESFNMVDIYPLMCQILGVNPAINHGSIDNVKDLLLNPPVWYQTFETTAISFIAVVIVAALVGGVFAIGVVQQGRKYRRRRQQQNRAYSSPSKVHSLPETDSMLRSTDEEDEDI